MMHDGLVLMLDLLNPRGSIWVHLDYRVGSQIPCTLENVFSSDSFLNEVIWRYRAASAITGICDGIDSTVFFRLSSAPVESFTEVKIGLMGADQIRHSLDYSFVEVQDLHSGISSGSGASPIHNQLLPS